MSRPLDSKLLDQPNPLPSKGDIWTLLIKDMEERRKVGIERYGTPLQPFNGRNAPVDLCQELLDALVYARQWIEERQILLESIKAKDEEIALLKEKLKEAVLHKVGPRQRHIEERLMSEDNPEQ